MMSGEPSSHATDLVLSARVFRTVLATSLEPAHDLGLYPRLLIELHALVCGSLARRVAVKRAVVATARDGTGRRTVHTGEII